MPTTPCTTWAVLPVNHLSLAKSRLAACLGEYRAAFAKCLMLHTLAALQTSGVFDCILVVTPDESVAALATAKNADVLADCGTSLNEACALGLAETRSRGADLTVIVHADLALLCADDMRLLIAGYRAACERAKRPLLGLLRCKDGGGTNIIFCARETDFVPQFGPRSFARHTAESSFYELRNANAAFDIDTCADLAQLFNKLDQLDPTDPIALLLRNDRLNREILQP